MIDLRRWLLATLVLTVSANLAHAQPYLISTFAGGLPSPTAVPANPYIFESPTGVATDHFGNTYISTSYNCVFRLDPQGYLSRVAGNCRLGFSGDGGTAINAQLNSPQGLAVDSAGNLYIADQGNNRIRQVTPSGVISTVAGTGTAGYNGDNISATAAQLNSPQGVTVDRNGALYIADTVNYRIRRVVLNGTITTVAGTGVSASGGDNGPATSAALSYPTSLAFDSNGQLYVSDRGSYRVRLINTAGTILRFAGSGPSGSLGDSGPAISATLSNPEGLAIDAAGNVYIAEQGSGRVRKVDVAGIISTYAGGGMFGSGGDGGPATSAQLQFPASVSADYSGNLFIADHAGLVRKVNASGIISTVAGNPNSSLPFSGDGGLASLAQFGTPRGLARDSSGNLYVADWNNDRLRKIDMSGIVTTIAGNGVQTDAGDGGLAISASVTPFVVSVDSQGNLYLADSAIIRKINPAGVIPPSPGPE